MDKPITHLSVPGRRRSWLGLLIPAVLVFAVLLALGTWQLQRKAWKEGLIVSLTEKLDAPAIALPPPASWPHLDEARDEYRRVKFHAQSESGTEALVYASAAGFRPDVNTLGAGYWVFVPAKLPDGAVVVVNRGFVPSSEWNAAARAAAQISGDGEITGVMRWPDTSHWFTPKAEPAHNLWFLRDPAAIAAAKGWPKVAPFYVEQESPAPSAAWPKPGKLVVHLPNDHLQYAVTWYGLALMLVIVFVAFAFKSRREAARQSAD
jgi:surfeit locus 1 family protein